MECACAQTESLRGAAVNAYLTRFLERVSDTADQAAGTYQCRVCGTRWLRQVKDEHQPAQLVRLATEALSQETE
jgi:hypothetical protein